MIQTHFPEYEKHKLAHDEFQLSSQIERIGAPIYGDLN